MFSNEILNIITPFKGNAIKELKSTVNCLIRQECLEVNHILVIDPDSYEITRDLFQNLEILNKNYVYELFISNKKGIYSSINQALDILVDSQPYLVLGAGDIIKINSKFKFDAFNQIYYFPYCLSSNLGKLINNFRNIFTGMPYCHNALIFRKNQLRYNQIYSLSGDYDYFLRYLNNFCSGRKLLKQNKLIKEIKSGFVIYESNNGLSSKKKGLVHFQNLQIIFKEFKIFGIFFYLSLLFYKHFIRIFIKIKTFILNKCLDFTSKN